MSDAMANRSGREALRGAEVHTLDLIFEVLPSDQWAEMLRAPLELAATKGNRDLAQRLVRAGAETGVALHQAIRGGHGEIVSDLLESGASLDAKDTTGRTPLNLAAFLGKTEMVQQLLLKGADIDAFDNEEYTSLHLAAFYGRLSAALALLSAGADVSLRCGEHKFPLIHAAAQNGYVDILRAAIEHGADVDAVDNIQDTALHIAAIFNDAEAIDVLVGAGANVEAGSHDGCTPLHDAAAYISRDALLCLLKHGATVNSQNDSLETPLVCAAAKAGTQGAAEVVDSLLRAGADEMIVDGDGNKPADVIGGAVGGYRRLAEDVERVRELLANAPADRAWRRRSYLVLCRAHPDRVQHSQVIGVTHRTDTTWRAGNSAGLARAGGIEGESTMDESTGGDWTFVVSKVLLLQEEGIFRTIVGYL